MDIDRVMQAVEVVQELAQAASALPEAKTEAVGMSISLSIAALYMAEYANHLAGGAEPYDALVSTANGELELTDKQRSLIALLSPFNARDPK